MPAGANPGANRDRPMQPVPIPVPPGVNHTAKRVLGCGGREEAKPGVLYKNKKHFDDYGVGGAIEVGDVIGVGFDLDTGELWSATNGIWVQLSHPEQDMHKCLAAGGYVFPAISLKSGIVSVNLVDCVGRGPGPEWQPVGIASESVRMELLSGWEPKWL